MSDNCVQCGIATCEAVQIKKKWVSWGPVGIYKDDEGNPRPVSVSCCEGCRSAYLNDRPIHFSIVDEVFNVHADFHRVDGQFGVLAVGATAFPIYGWQTTGEFQVKYGFDPGFRLAKRYDEKPQFRDSRTYRMASFDGKLSSRKMLYAPSPDNLHFACQYFWGDLGTWNRERDMAEPIIKRRFH